MTTHTLSDHHLSTPSARRRWGLLASLAAGVCLLIAAVLPAGAAAANPPGTFNPPVPACPSGPASSSTDWCVAAFSASNTNQDGTPDTQAGSHPFASTTSFTFSTDSAGVPTENMKDISVELPAGFVGDPNATPKCTVEQLDINGCPVSSQIGTLTLQATVSLFHSAIPVYNMVPPAGDAAQFGANLLLIDAFIDVKVRTGGDYGLTAGLTDTSTLLPLFGSSLTLWGVPGDPGHDLVRTCPGGASPCPAAAGDKPFLTMPTQCGPLQYNIAADSWQGDSASMSFNDPNPITGCGVLSFNPSIDVGLGSSAADSPTSVSVDLHVPQGPDSPGSLAAPSLKSAVVTLPPGIALSPSAADGLQACSVAQFGPDTAAEPACPDASKIGTAEIDSPISADPLTGGIFLAQQNDNPFGSTFAIYVAAEADGTLIKLAAKIEADPVTGQLTTTFDGMPAFGGNPAFPGNPQLPFSDFKLNFFGGSRAALMTGETCGTSSVSSDIAPWSSPGSGPNGTPSASLAVTSGCVSGFAPSFTAGSTNGQAGAFSPFVLSFARSDSDQDLSGLTVTLPPGVSAQLAGVPLCSGAEIAQALTPGRTGAQELASPSCPASSRVGTAQTSAGPGSDPFALTGGVYLTGPFNGAPYGLVVVVPAVAGPLDLGVVVVRESLNVDPTDAHVTVTSQPFPTILDGVPLRLRRVNISLDRANFTLNPTSCDPMQILGVLTSAAGATASGFSHFQVGGCSSLGFSPSLKISLTGKGKTRSGDHPTLSANLSQPSGQANIGSARVTLPLSLALDPKNSERVCPFATAEAVHGGAVGCASDTIVGTASATTPLLSQPLTGSIYLVQGIRTNAAGQQIRTLPTLLLPLRGQFALDLRASTSVSHGKLVTTFSNVPDVPVSAFDLSLTGGPKGLLVITGRNRSICGAPQRSAATLDAQSGAQMDSSIKMATPCKKLHHKPHKRPHKKKK